jgi:hypothetical protein
MIHLLGLDDQAWRSDRQATPVVLKTESLINGHMLFAGMSGTGKSYQILALLNSAARQGVQVDVFDVHEELDRARDSCALKFSEATQTGYNPLSLSLDPHSGGVRKQIAWLIDTINRSSRQLGPRQESALRNLLSDVYYLRGIYADNPSTWARQEITEAQYDDIVRSRRWADLKAYYPTLRDVISYAERKLKAMSIGSDNRAVNALERVEQSLSRLNAANTKYGKASNDEEVGKLEKQIANEREKAIEAYCDFINGLETGKEFSDFTKYTNRDTLLSLIERLQGLYDGGVFRSNPPQWGGATVRVYQIGSLSDEERRLLFYTRAQAILRECMDAGKSDTLRRILLIDEGHLYYSEDGDNPMNRIAKEGRKFGLGLVIASQSPTHFSEDFLTNCGTIMLMGIHEQFWDMACRKLRIERQVLQSVRAREVVALKAQRLGEPSARFMPVNVNHAAVEEGLRQLQLQRQRAA